MRLIPHRIADLISNALHSAQADGSLPEFEVSQIPIQPAKNPELADYASPIALQLAKVARNKPLTIAETIANHINADEAIESIEVAPPGFLNFRLNPNWVKAQVETILEEGGEFGSLKTGQGKRAQVEFVSANPSGPITVGRTRGGVVGDTMARLLEASGYKVEREYYFNNAGNQMKILGNSLRLRYLEALGRDVKIPDADDTGFYQGDYLIDFAQELVQENGDAYADEEWEFFKEFAEAKMFVWIKDSLSKINIHHDVYFNENSLFDDGSVWNVLEELSENGYVYSASVREDATEEEIAEAQGVEPAQWFRSTKFGDEKDRVVVRSDGVPTYTLPDIAYHKNKIERGFDLMVNVLGSDHYTEHQVVKYGLQALGLDPSNIQVILNQMIHLVHDGERLKMSTRRGNFETLDDLVEQTSPDVVRYMILARNANSDVDFDLDLAVRQSNENPVYYIQNAHVRCAGILREAQARGLSDDGADVSLLGDDAVRFLQKALQLGEIIETSVDNFEPHKIAFYAHELASVFHPIYDKVRALHGEVPEDLAKARLRFYRAAKVIFERVLTLMGMSAPERM